MQAPITGSGKTIVKYASLVIWSAGTVPLVSKVGNAQHFMYHMEMAALDQEQQFLDAYEKHSDAIFKHCFFRLSDRERALDLTQETFTRAWDYIAKGKTVEAFKPFLYRVASNLIVEEYRKKKSVSLDGIFQDNEVDEGSFESLRDEGAYDALADAFDGERAKKALEELPEQHRQVLTLRFMDGLSLPEIAACLEIRENTVSVRLYRALNELKKNFAL